MIGLNMLLMDLMSSQFDWRYAFIHIAILAIEITAITFIVKKLRTKRKN